MVLSNNHSKRRNIGKASIAIVSVLILGLLIFSVPAKAFVLNIDVKGDTLEQGQSAIVDVSVSIPGFENIAISKLIFSLEGKKNSTCEFTSNGIILSGCSGMTITKLESPSTTYSGYGYGYGYGSNLLTGKLSYRILIDSSNYPTGEYNTKLIAFINNNQYAQSGEVLTIESASGTSDSEEYTSIGRVCVNDGWTCSAWSSCENGKQTRVCEMTPNCFLSSKPAEERQCVLDENDENILKLTDPYKTLKVSGESVIVENPETLSFDDQLLLIIFALIVAILILLIVIFSIVLGKRLKTRKKILRKRRKLESIRFNPNKK